MLPLPVPRSKNVVAALSSGVSSDFSRQVVPDSHSSSRNARIFSSAAESENHVVPVWAGFVACVERSAV